MKSASRLPAAEPVSVWEEKVWMVGNFEGDALGGPCSLAEIERDIKAKKWQGHELVARMGTKRWRPVEKAFARAREIEAGSQPTLVPPEASESYYLTMPGKAGIGPLSLGELRVRLSSGAFGREANVCKVGASSWLKVVDLPDLAPFLPPAVTEQRKSRRPWLLWGLVFAVVVGVVAAVVAIVS